MKKIMMIMAMCLMTFTLAAQQGQGQRGQGQGRFGFNWDEIPGITAEQKTKIAAIETAQREEMQKTFPMQQGQPRQQLTEAQRAERTKKMTELREKTQKEIKAVLTPEQVKVYDQKMAEREKARAERAAQRGQGQRPAAQ